MQLTDRNLPTLHKALGAVPSMVKSKTQSFSCPIRACTAPPLLPSLTPDSLISFSYSRWADTVIPFSRDTAQGTTGSPPTTPLLFVSPAISLFLNI